jgi:hypothetical protein
MDIVKVLAELQGERERIGEAIIGNNGISLDRKQPREA